jgi:hypothetical protein
VSAGGYQVDAGTVRRHAGEFPGLADQVSGAHRELSDALEQTGTCWGEDAVGRSFAEGHVRAASDTLDRLGALPGRLTDVGDRLHRTADAYQQVEQTNADALRGDPQH